MSSSRAHARLTGQQHETTKKQPPGPASRIPIKPVTAERDGQQKGAERVARMIKGTSRTAPTIETNAKGRMGTTAVLQDHLVSNRRTYTTPPSFVPPTTRTPSLFSGSSVSTMDSPRSNVLRRKPSGAIDRYALQRRERSGAICREREAMHDSTGFFHEDSGNTVLGITIPATSKFNERQSSIDLAEYSYISNAPHDLIPPIPHYASSATPSTRYSDSPFSPVPTPSSASSYSPGLAATSYSHRSPINARLKDDQSRHGLAPVREAYSSSKSAPRVDRKLSYEKQITVNDERAPSLPASTGRSTFRNRLTKSRLNVAAEKPKIQMPPELAHLNLDVQPDVLKSRAPGRPSRFGTSTIADMVNHASVVQSELPPVYTTYHKRGPSQETPTSASSPTKSRFGFSSRVSSRTVSPRVDSAISSSDPARQFHRSQTPEIPSGEGARLRRKDSPAVSQSPAKSPRFGFLSRKPKPELSKAADKPARRMSKGPVAGSGHEGYGKFSFRGRSNSNASASSSGVRSPSSDSMSSGVVRPASTKRKSSTGSKSEPELDDFLAARVRPVILRGSGSTMSTDTVDAILATASSKSSSLDGSSQSQLLPSAIRKASDPSIESLPSAKWNAAERPENHGVRRRPTLATRRSITRLSSGENRSPVRLPPPIKTNLFKQSSGLDSYDAEPTAWPRTDSSLPLSEDGKEGLWLKPLDIELSPKPARKWNFVAVHPFDDVQLSQDRAVPYYAMSDDTNELRLEDVEQIVRDSTDFEEDTLSDSEPPTVVSHEERHSSVMLPPLEDDYGRVAYFSARPHPPKLGMDPQDSAESSHSMLFRPAPQQVMHSERRLHSAAARAVHTPDMTERSIPDHAHGHLTTPEQSNGSPRQSRLSPIGRIPAVVSRRDRDRKLPNTSFSRPFASQNRPFAKPPGSVYSQIREMASPVESSSQPVSSTSTRSDSTTMDPVSNTQKSPSVATHPVSVEMHPQSEFLAFPPRKNSDQSYSNSDSSSVPSWMTALPPQKEDVWNEYNDFMDEVMPMRTPTTGSSLGAPFQYSSMLWNGNGTSRPIPVRSGLPPTQQLPAIPGNTVRTVLTIPQQISRFLRPSLSPITPDTISGLGCHIGNFPPRQASLHHAHHMYTPPPKRSSLVRARASISSGSRHSTGSSHSRSASVPIVPHLSSRLTDQPLLHTTMNKPFQSSPGLRLHALLTSKWLSSNRLLFSPAHNETQLSSSPRILILDGLNSDWSHFIATSYPCAEIYNLTSSPLESSSPLGIIPRNHHHIPLPSLSTTFPFPKSFFTSIVLRFPTATTETTYASCLTECKRVLRPGGFIEIAILDLDLTNTGPKARKAVRGLKTRMQARDAEVCLGNLSDLLVRLMGRRGFEGVQKCLLGVPVVGDLPLSERSTSFSSSSSSSSSSGGKDLNLADRVHAAQNIGNDENLTKIVARVGRWWYSSCYERALLPGGDRSIWRDRTLLKECEKHGTNFRILMGFAQKPTQVKRRTRSV